jgi:hypothetical protein
LKCRNNNDHYLADIGSPGWNWQLSKNELLLENKEPGEVYYVCEKGYLCKTFSVRQKEKMNETVPCSVMEVDTVQGQGLTRRLIVLFDPGSTNSYLKGSVLPKGANKRQR